MAQSVGRLLVDAGLSVGILGNEETCDGNDVRALGEMGLFAELAQANIDKFKVKGRKENHHPRSPRPQYVQEGLSRRWAENSKFCTIPKFWLN